MFNASRQQPEKAVVVAGYSACAGRRRPEDHDVLGRRAADAEPEGNAVANARDLERLNRVRAELRLRRWVGERLALANRQDRVELVKELLTLQAVILAVPNQAVHLPGPPPPGRPLFLR